jgi:hypothetical protein
MWIVDAWYRVWGVDKPKEKCDCKGCGCISKAVKEIKKKKVK